MPDDSDIAAPAALDYAGPRDASGFADAAVEGRLEFRAAVRAIGDARVAARALKDAVERRYSARSVGDACAACGASPCAGVITVGWRFEVPQVGLSALPREREVKASADAAFPLCAGCVAPMRATVAAANRRNDYAKGLFAGGLLVIAASAFVPTDVGKSAVALLGVAALAVGCVLRVSSEASLRKALPSTIARAVPEWLGFERYVSFAERRADA